MDMEDEDVGIKCADLKHNIINKPVMDGSKLNVPLTNEMNFNLNKMFSDSLRAI